MPSHRSSHSFPTNALTLTALSVPKNRRPKFELCLLIIDLNNVPLVSGNCFIKWHLPSSTAAEHRGRTPKRAIQDHKVTYDYEKTLPVRLVVGKDQVLQETWIDLEVLQEYSSGGRGERIVLGSIKLNLAEYVEASDTASRDGDGVVTRRYLMQESKINSTLKLGISMRHIEGDRNYTAPQLKTAPVFGGIAGIMAHDAAEVAEDDGYTPNVSSKSQETGELQDMYRKTLTASWAAQPGELKADECIEDIFGGGNGWGSHIHKGPGKPPTIPRRLSYSGPRASGDRATGYSDDDESRNETGAHQQRAGWSASNSKASRHGKSHYGNVDEDISRAAGGGDGWNRGHGMAHGVSGRAGLRQLSRKTERSEERNNERASNEIDEFNNPYRQDLRSWKIGQSATA